MGLHPFIVRSAPTFRRDPVDYLVGIGDVAGFAVDAVREVHFQFATARLRIRFHFIDLSRTKTLARISVLFGTSGRTDLGVEYVEVRRLIFIMSHGSVVDIRDLIERELLVDLHTPVSLFNGWQPIPRQHLHSLMPCDVMLLRHKSPGEALGKELKSRIYQCRPSSRLERRVEISNGMKLVVDPA